MVGAEFLRQFGLVSATGNRRDLEAHMTSILHTQVTKPADTKYRDKITGLCWRVS
jgi:hypothetical protein